MKGSSRRKVIWIGEPGQIARQFKSRNLQVDISELANTAPARESHWAKSCGLVVSYRLRPEYRNACEKALKLLDEALSFGLRIEILGEGAEAAHLEQMLKTLGIMTNSSVVVRTNYDLDDVAERFSQHAPGPGTSFGKPVFTLPCTDGARFLLRRAFSDCEELVCQALPHPSGEREVFHVHALLKKSLGRRLQPFFVKIDTERRISEEIRNYEMYVDGFVPFHLRPNLVEQRSLTTPAGGIIVGNFADHCESFVSAARRGIGPSIVHSVFAETLRGWRLAQDRDQKATSLVSSLGGAIKATSLPADRLQRAKELGAVSEATDLIERIGKAGKLDHLTSLAHRDLHVSNVMVRNRDAIVIDFGSVGTGPLVGDPALLEASLLCTLDRAESQEDFAAWQRLASELMDRKHFENAPPHVFSPSPREWLWETVRALRLIGLASQTTKYEYAVALAHCLLAQVRVAINPLEHDRRAFAYLLSERILDQVLPGTQ